MTAVGLLCRQYSGINPRNPSLLAGLERLKAPPPEKLNNVYYLYYATQVMHHMNGDSWKFWQWGPDGKGPGGIREVLLAKQDGGYTPAHDHQMSSWGGSSGGRIMATSLSLLMLEMDYHKLLLFKKEAPKPNK